MNLETIIKTVKSLFSKGTEENHAQEVASKSLLNLVLRVAGRGFNYILIFMIIRLFGNDDFGKWVLVSTLFMVLQMLSGMGIRIASIRFFAEFLDEAINLKDYFLKAVGSLIISSVLCFAAVHMFAHFLNDLFQKEYVSEYLKIMAWAILPLNLVDFHAGIARGLRKIGLFSFLDSFSKPLFLILLLLIATFYDLELSQLFWYYNASIATIAILSAGLIWRVFSKLGADLSKGKKLKLKTIFSISLPMLATSSVDMINRWADLLILGFYSNDFLIGAYGLAARISGVIPISLQAVNSISTSKYRELYVSEKRLELKKLVQKSGKMIFWLGMIPGSAILVAGAYLLSFFNPAYQVAYWALMLLSVGQIVNVIAGSTFPLLNMTDSHRGLMNIAMLSAFLNVVLNLYLIPVYGILGAAIATLAATLLNNFLCVLLIRKKLGFNPVYLPFLS